MLKKICFVLSFFAMFALLIAGCASTPTPTESPQNTTANPSEQSEEVTVPSDTSKPAPNEEPSSSVGPKDFYSQDGFNVISYVESLGLIWQRNGPHGGIIRKNGSGILYAEIGIDIVLFAVQKDGTLEVYSIFGFLTEHEDTESQVNFGKENDPKVYTCPTDNLNAFIQGIQWFAAGDYATDPLLGFSHTLNAFHTFSIAPEGYLKSDYADRIMSQIIDATGNVKEETIF